MATVNDTEDQEQAQKPGAPLAVSGTAGASSSGGQGFGVGGATPQSPVAQNEAPQANTGYTDVGTYLDANRSGSQQLGNMVGSELTDRYNQTTAGVESSARTAQDAAKAGYVPENRDLIQQVANNPTEAANDPNNSSLVQAQLNDKYTGPSDWADYGTQRGKVNEATQEGALTTTPGGLNVLTQQVEGKTGGSQSQGINQLDTLLLGGSPSAMQTVQSAADPYKTLNDFIDKQNTAVWDSINSAKTAADQARTNAQTALLGPNGATGQLNTQIDQQTAQARQQAQSLSDQIKATLKSENPTPDQLALIGMSSQQWQELQAQLNLAQNSRLVESNQKQFGANTGTTDIDLTNWLTQLSPEAEITRQNAATADQYARAEAFQRLLGTDYWTTDLVDPSLAGTAPKNLNQFNYNEALTGTTDAAETEKAMAQAYVDALQAGADEEHARLAEQNTAKNMSYGTGASFASTPIAATSGVIAAGIGAGQDVGKQFSTPTNAGISTAANILSGGLYTPGRAVTEGVANAAKTIGKIFCFHPETQVEMEDGSSLPIHCIRLDDTTKGGNVLAIKVAKADSVYSYGGVMVTGSHAVNDQGIWKRVADCAAARPCAYSGEVYNLVTENHRIWSNGVEFADEVECDEYEFLTMDQSLDKLNEKVDYAEPKQLSPA